MKEQLSSEICVCFQKNVKKSNEARIKSGKYIKKSAALEGLNNGDER